MLVHQRYTMKRMKNMNLYQQLGDAAMKKMMIGQARQTEL